MIQPVEVKLTHTDEMKFQVALRDGRFVRLDSSEWMDQAFTPMELFLVALAGCTAMDVHWIMDKQRQQVDKFEVTARGTRRDEDPKYYERVDLGYTLVGPGIRKDAVEKAIRLSLEKYCSVRAMLKDSVKLQITYKIASNGNPEQKYEYSAPATP
jgi:putative redox protein